MSAFASTPHLPLRSERKRSDAPTRQGEDGGDNCRICRSEGTPGQPLFYPCKCSGSIKYVHQECLMEWLSHSQKKYCELCKTPFRFTKLYHQSMPEQVPFHLFLRKAALHTVKALSRWCRYILVIFIWLCWLPWTIRQIWRGLFWIADGSWMASYELQAALQTHATHSNSSTFLPNALTNITLSHSTSFDSMAYVKSLAGLLSLFDFAATIRWTLRFLLTVILSSGTLNKWGHGFLSFTPYPRPPSLLSDVKTINSATSSSLFNNAIIDVLEGQLICLTIIAVFILVFLIREWVINQQPPAHIPDAEQPNEVPEIPRQADQDVQGRPQDSGVLYETNITGTDVQLAPENRPRVHPRARRRATENNILVDSNPASGLERPALPTRAASLIPALQEMEDNLRQLEDLSSSLSTALSALPTVESQVPPLQRGLFDEIGQIHRHIEEQNRIIGTSKPEDEPQEIAENNPLQSAFSPQDSSQPFTAPFTFRSLPNPNQNDVDAEASKITLHAGSSSATTEFPDNSLSDPVAKPGVESVQSSDSEVDTTHTPQTSDTSQQSPLLADQDTNPADVDEFDTSETTGLVEQSSDNDDAVPIASNNGVWMSLADWMWRTDDLGPTQTLIQSAENSEIVENIDEQLPFVPIANDPVDENAPHIPDAGPAAVPPAREPNVQDGINFNDLNAVDDAEDLEGILELIGMEGPMAGMIQNIIFSVFLISLTLSASVWCPYIWGKIALLLLAHPIGVFVKAPLYLVSRTADVIVDLFLVLIGGTGIVLNNLIKILKIFSMPLVPSFSRLLNVRLLEDYFYSLSVKSGGRLERIVTGTFWNLRPDLPTFSMQSHHVLRVFTVALTNLGTQTSEVLLQQSSAIAELMTWRGLYQLPLTVGSVVKSLPGNAKARLVVSRAWFTQLQDDLRPLSFAKLDDIDYSLVSWSSQEKIICIVLGYLLFAIAGYLYLQIMNLILGLKKNEKVPGVLADVLRQAGGVLKVIVIIGIEMIIFPLYCGTMLDIALLPLFEGATMQSRFTFFIKAPVTALFVHWFLGTCYMFHFALFVSMCRKLLRKGVLYFIRDPDDPTFHPVRDVLERTVATQLGKIAFSALVYGSLLIFCLGGAVIGLDHLGDVLPIHWSAREPLMKVPVDIIFYNFMLPFILRRIDLSDKVSVVFQWWFKACAAGLRLTDFLFGIDSEPEKQPGIFLWSRFFNKLRMRDTEDNPALPDKDNVKYFEKLAKHPERLFWFENLRGKADEEAIRKVFGAEFNFRLLHLSPKDSQVLIRFDKRVDLKIVEQIIERENKNDENNYKIRQVKDMNIQVLFLRNTPVHPSAGTYVRAPAKDSVRIPKGVSVFLPVDEQDRVLGEFQDGKTANKDDRFARIFIPTHFKARISTFIALIWLFAAFLGLTFTIGPLLVGRFVIKSVAGIGVSVNDLYAITVGTHVLGGIIYSLYKIISRYDLAIQRIRDFFTNTRQALSHITSAFQKVLGITYLVIALGVILPLALSILTELYIHVPVHTYVVANRNDTVTSLSNENPISMQELQSRSELPIIHLLQTWTIGILYLRIAIRVLSTTPHNNTQAATAIRAIVRNGYTRPDIRLASRALILPVLTVCIILLGLPLLVAQTIIVLFPQDLTTQQMSNIYLYCYPAHLLVAVTAFIIYRMKARLEAWRIKIRDEVYLIGERLHNFPNQEKNLNGRKNNSKPNKSNTGNDDSPKAGSDTTKGKKKSSDRASKTTSTNANHDSAETSDDEMQELEEALKRSSADFLNVSVVSKDQIPEASSSRSNNDRRDSVFDEIEEFKNITGLEGLAGADEIGDTMLDLLTMQHEDVEGGYR